MEKDKLPPIPTPASQRWREFRIQVLPFVVFFSVLAGIVYLWRAYVQPIGVIGSVETNMVSVTSLSDGIVSKLFVERFQIVTNGEDIAVVANTDPELIKAQMAVAQTEVNLLRTRLEVDQRRTTQGYQQLRVQLMQEQVARAIAEANLINANSNYLRTAELVKSHILFEASLDAAKSQRDALQAEVNERTALMTDLRGTLTTITNTGGDAAQDPFNAAIEAKTRELDLTLKPITLKAPISGIVTMVHHVPGERILRGAPVISISDPESRRIVAYIRQPVTEVPTTNDFVHITTRSQPRQDGRAPILRVGAQMESISPALLSADTKRMEVGLPILIGVPPNMRLTPGEYLNLFIETGRK